MIKEVTLQITRNSPKNKGASKNLDVDYWTKIINSLSDMGIRKCAITGGDPVYHRDFYEILQYSVDSFSSVAVETYGVNRSNFSDYDCRVFIWFEDWVQSKHDAIMGMSKIKNAEGKVESFSSFAMASRKLSVISNDKICRFSLHRSTDVEESMVFAEKNFAGTRFVPSGNNIINSERLNSLFKTIKRYDARFPHTHRIDHPAYYLWNKELRHEFLDKYLRGIYINAEGKVHAHPELIEKLKIADTLDLDRINRKMAILEYEFKKNLGGNRNGIW